MKVKVFRDPKESFERMSRFKNYYKEVTKSLMLNLILGIIENLQKTSKKRGNRS